MPIQTTSQVLMIRPVRFAGNVQTASSNRFQHLPAALDAADVQQWAVNEFDGLVSQLRDAGVNVMVLNDTPEPHTPDSIFPNNWFSTHADGTVVLYPMQAVNRRAERRADVFAQLRAQGLVIERVCDLTAYEAQDLFLEGTGSLVLDRVNRIAYACLSPRTHGPVLNEFAQRLNYELVTFDALDAQGVPIYHTNVLMCVGVRMAVVCVQAIALAQRARVCERLQATGHQLIEITPEQMQHFAGNMLELQGNHGTVLALSQAAWAVLTPTQRQALQAAVDQRVVAVIPTIERLGGGSVRCMLAEIFLPAVAR